MSKEIKLETLAAFDEEYMKDPIAKVMRRALAKNGIDSIAYVEENEYRTLPTFSIDIPTMSATNQKASGRCWLFAGMNVLREKIAKKCNMKEFELSQNYIAFYDKLEKINWTMEALIENRKVDKDDRTLVWILQNAVQDGGQWDMIVSLVKKYGIVPKSVMNESFTSSSTRYLNQLINQRLRKFNAKIRIMDESQIEAYKEDTLKELYGFLCTCFGLPPKTFDFEYVDKDAQYVRLSKEKLRKIIIWQKSGSQRQKNKGEVVDQMFAIMKERKDGHYFFQNEVCEYEIKIDESLIILRNIRKQIEYYII